MQSFFLFSHKIRCLSRVVTKILFRTLLLLLTVLFISACNKADGEITLSGTVLDQFTGGAVGGAEVRLAYSELNNGAFSNSFKSLATVQSGSDGTYEIKFERQSVVEFRVQIVKEGYFFYEEIINGDDWRGEEIRYDPRIRKQSRIEVSLINEPTAQSNDQVIFRFLNALESCAGCCGNGVTTHTGTEPMVFECSVVGSRNLEYEYIAIDPDGSTTTVDTIFVQANQVTKLEVRY